MDEVGCLGWGRKGKSAGHAASLSAIHSRVWPKRGKGGMGAGTG